MSQLIAWQPLPNCSQEKAAETELDDLKLRQSSGSEKGEAEHWREQCCTERSVEGELQEVKLCKAQTRSYRSSPLNSSPNSRVSLSSYQPEWWDCGASRGSHLGTHTLPKYRLLWSCHKSIKRVLEGTSWSAGYLIMCQAKSKHSLKDYHKIQYCET